MFKCLECDKLFKSILALSVHIGKTHMPIIEYKRKHKLIKLCAKCEKELSWNNKSGFCDRCRDRSGKNNPAYGKSYPVSPEKRKKHSIITKNLWKQEDYRNKVIKGVSKPRREGFSEEQSARTKQWFIDNPEQRTLRSERMKRSWEEGSIVPNNDSCNRSKLELQLRANIEEILPGSTSTPTLYTIDGDYLFPDMVLEREGMIIEFYGNYWHMNPKFYNADDINLGRKASEVWKHDEERIKKFDNIRSEEGEDFLKCYNVITVWEDEYLNDKEQLLDHLDKILNWESCIF